MDAPNDATHPNELLRNAPFRVKPLTKPKAITITESLPPAYWVGEPLECGAVLRLKRETWGGLLVSFTVELGDCLVGYLAYGKTLEVQIPAGKHLLIVSGGGAFIGAQKQFLAQPLESVTYRVYYAWYGGVKLSRR